MLSCRQGALQGAGMTKWQHGSANTRTLGVSGFSLPTLYSDLFRGRCLSYIDTEGEGNGRGVGAAILTSKSSNVKSWA